MMGFLTVWKAVRSFASPVIQSYIKGRENVAMREVARQMQRDVLANGIKKKVIDSADHSERLVSNIIEQDRKDSTTAWVRPVSIGMSLVMWAALVLSQISYTSGGQVLPIVWHVPPGQYGELLFMLPVGIIGTFIVTRPIEKIAALLKGL